MIPAFVIVRDRVSYARQCAKALALAGLDVHIVDHGSTWQPAVDWLETCEYPVHKRENGHPRSLWDWDGLKKIVGTNRPYVVTDPDVVPDPECPSDWPVFLLALLQRYPDMVKVGLGLRTDDLPSHYLDAHKVKEWEAQYWVEGPERDVYEAHTDTTLALYRPLNAQPKFELGPALRTGGKYVADHLAWHEDSLNPTAEIVYYREHAEPGISHWLDPDEYMKEAQ